MKYRERNEVQRWLFRRELAQIAGQPVFYLDECGVDHRLYREFGRAPRGERIYEAVAGKRRERTRLIAASQQGKLVAPLVFQGSCTTGVVDAYFEKVLLPELPPGSVIVLDNARFHQSPTTQQNWWKPPGASCSFCRPTRPTSIPLNISGPPSRPAAAKTSPPPPTPFLLSPICPNVIINCYSVWAQEYWQPRVLQAGWKYRAVLPPEKARGQVTMKRLMPFVGEENGVAIQVFADPEKALQWLAEQA